MAAAHEDNTSLSWWDPHPMWGEQLRRDNVLYYFSGSPFFDHSSNNNKCRQRGLDQNYVAHLE
jgi:hypothetical protein